MSRYLKLAAGSGPLGAGPVGSIPSFGRIGVKESGTKLSKRCRTAKGRFRPGQSMWASARRATLRGLSHAGRLNVSPATSGHSTLSRPWSSRRF